MRNIIASLLLFAACSTTKDPGQTTVKSVDLEKFMGNWFEIARIGTPLQSECASGKITYKRDGKDIQIIHACHEREKGKLIHARGLAEIEDKKTNAKWRVSFVPLFKNWHAFGSSVWIIGLDPEYQYAILGHPTHKHFGIIARTPEIAPEKYEELLQMAESQGYKRKDISRVPAWK